jgi:hypothetical protein
VEAEEVEVDELNLVKELEMEMLLVQAEQRFEDHSGDMDETLSHKGDQALVLDLSSLRHGTEGLDLSLTIV